MKNLQKFLLFFVLISLINCTRKSERYSPEPAPFPDEETESEFSADKEVEEEDEEEVFVIVEVMPKFQGGDINNFSKYIQENIQYPELAAKSGISGKVFVQFVVNSKGNVVNARILRGVDPSLDAEALRVIQSSPPWEPGLQGGKPVSVQFTFPIVFVLQ